MADKPKNPIMDILLGEETPPEWLVRNVITQGSFGCLVGESGAGKSVVSYMMALAVAAGMPMFGGLIAAGEPRRVLYFDDENSTPDRNKYLRQAWLGLKELEGETAEDFKIDLLFKNFWPLRLQRELREGQTWDMLVREYVEALQPHYMVFDTANSCFDIKEENSNSEALGVINKLKTLMELTQPVCSVNVIKHAKTRTEKGQIRTVRGAKGWKDSSDWFLFQVKGPGRPRKDDLHLTRLIPDKARAYGLRKKVYITPGWTSEERNGLILLGNFKASKEHKASEKDDE